MQDITKEQFDSAFENLPEEISTIIYHLHTEDVISSLAETYKLEPKEEDALNTDVNLFLAGIKESNYIFEKVMEMNLADKEKADLLDELNQNIIIPFEEQIDVLNEESEHDEDNGADYEELERRAEYELAHPDQLENMDQNTDTDLSPFHHAQNDSYHEKIEDDDSENVIENLIHPKKTTDIIPASKGYFDVKNKESDEKARAQKAKDELAKLEADAHILASSVVSKSNFGYNPALNNKHSPIIDGNNVDLTGMDKPTPEFQNMTKVEPISKPETMNTTNLRNTQVAKVYQEIPEKIIKSESADFEFNKIEKVAGINIPSSPLPGKTLSVEPEKNIGGYVKRQFRKELPNESETIEPASEEVANANNYKSKNEETMDRLNDYFKNVKDLNSKSTTPNQSLQFLRNAPQKEGGEKVIPKAPSANETPSTDTDQSSVQTSSSDKYREAI